MRESKVLLTIWQLSLALCVCEVGYGMFAHSMGLISDGIHTAANCLGVGTSLFAVKFSKLFAPKGHTMDLSARAEVLAAFTNSVILLLLAAFLCFECAHQLVEAAHHSDHAEHVLWVTLISVSVHLYSLWLLLPLTGGISALSRRFFSSSGEFNDESRLLNFDSVALHIMFDLMSSIAVALSSMIAPNTKSADPLLAIGIALLTARAATPLFMRSARVLAQASTVKTDHILRELSSIDGVLEFYQARFWSLAPSKNVASIILRVRAEADEARCLKQAHAVLAPSFQQVYIQIERDRPIHALGTASTASTAAPGPAHVRGPPQQLGQRTSGVPVISHREAAHIL